MHYLVLCGLIAVGVVACWWGLRKRNINRWLVGYIIDAPRRRTPHRQDTIHLLLCIADHFEPKWAHADAAIAARRVQCWVNDYPRVHDEFRDSDGRPPRHTFFYPEEEYEPNYLDSLGDLCRRGYAEVEVHLHHDNDTAVGLRQKLTTFKSRLSADHGLLARDKKTGQVAYAFVHGNWALNNSRPDGRWCGVNDEITELLATGCYADFTYPSAPSPTQTRTVNRIYYARGNPSTPRGHDHGTRVGTAVRPAGSLMLISGPLLLDWSRPKWGLLPRIENACIQASQHPSERRLELWLKAHVHVPGRADWYFVKLHTHGATESNQEILLGEPMRRFHAHLAVRAAQNPRFRYHYVTAREMFNLARAAEAGWNGSVADARDYQLVFGSN